MTNSILKFKKEDVIKLLSKLKKEDELVLVGDQGVYLMSFDEETKARTVVYAQGCNPKIDEDFYENKRYLFGGDDGSDKIGTVAEWVGYIATKKLFIDVVLTPTHITVRS